MITWPSGRDYLMAMLTLLIVGGGIAIGLEHLVIFLFHHLSFH